MKTGRIIQELNNSFKLINSQIYDDNDLNIVQILTSNNQTSIKHSLCILYNSIEHFRYDESCYYLIPSEYINNTAMKNNYSLYDRNDFINIVLFLYDLLTDKEEYLNKTRLLSSYILTHDSLDDIADYLYKLLNNPLVFVDAYFNSIACCPKEKTGLEVYDRFFDTVYPSIDVSFVEDNARELLYPDIIRTAVSNFLSNKVSCISSSVVADGRVISGFSVYALNRPFNQTDLKIIDYAMILLSSTKAVSGVKAVTNFASVYRKILSGSLDEESIYKASDKLKINFDEKYITILIKMENNIGLTNPLSEIKRKIDTRLFGFYENGLYITIKPEQLDNTVISLIRNKCRQHNSNYFVFDIPLPLRETDTVCRFLKELIELKPDHIASDIYYDIVFRYKDMLTDKHYLLYYDELKSLKQEDYLTVKEYIYSHLNLNRTSSNLCIHRNTLNYRLNKIADVLNIDFKDDKQVSNLLLTLKLSDKI